jgi:hypothetical protein
LRKLTNEEFVARAKDIHGEKYKYDRCKYEHSLKKVEIFCPRHGYFEIKPSNHINNRQGCWHCGNESTGAKQRKPVDSVLKSILSKPNSDSYDFSLVKDFRNDRSEPVTVVCSVHGPYERTVRDILRSKYFGCKKCKIADDTFTKEVFVEKSSQAHGNYYSYEKVNYTKSHDPVIVTCPRHGDFDVAPYIHINGGGFCPSCTNGVSSYEIELAEYIKKEALHLEIKTTYRKMKGVWEIDILAESVGLAIEFDGLYWHSSAFKKDNYHLNKTNRVAEAGFRLLHIFEDEWRDNKEICKSMVLNALGATKRKIHARMCEPREVSPQEASKFLEDSHIQGNCASRHRYGLYRGGELVSIMTFGGNRICLGSRSKESEFELLRFCNSKFTTVVGGASKLFAHFRLAHNPLKVTSYCDKRWGTGRLYHALGFKRLKDTPPNYFYVRGGQRFGRFGFRKDILVAKGHDPKKTERQIMAELGYNRIYDCGSMKFEWKRQQA